MKPTMILLCLSLFYPLWVGAAEPDLDAAIAKHRMGTITVQAEPGQEVKVEQVRHEFWFGAALANGMFNPHRTSEEAETYKEIFLQYFNAAVTENAVKWHSMEREQGKVDYSVVDTMLTWTDTHKIPLRAHNLYWGVSRFVQPWLKEMDDDTLRETLRQRALTMGARYKGRFAEYDLNNEMLHGNYYEDRLGPDITKQMVEWFRQEDPQTPLYLNDYDILTGKRLDDYVQQIRHLLDSGVDIGGIGVQGHLHGVTFEPEALQHALDTLAQFNLPIRVTEFNMPGQRSPYEKDKSLKMTEAEEMQKAEQLVLYYRICFAHPAVEGILMWGFWEGANWIPASSLFRRDWSPTPAAKAYHDQVYGEWWTKAEGQTDAEGKCEIPAFYGTFKITCGGQEKAVVLKKNEGSAMVSFREK